MFLTIQSARESLAKLWFIFAVCNSMAVACFTVPLFRDLPTGYFFGAMCIAASIGLATGLYVTYRSTFSSTYAFWSFIYFLFVIEFLLVGGGAAMAVWIAGRPDLCRLAVSTNTVALVIALAIGMLREACALGLFKKAAPDHWKKAINCYLDYYTFRVNPSLTSRTQTTSRQGVEISFWIVALGVTNLPLLFEIVGGGRNNSMFIAAPMLMGVFAYLNLRAGGAGLLRLLLLRKLERGIGRQFVNADLEQMQELRRGFVLSRWLMRDMNLNSKYSR